MHRDMREWARRAWQRLKTEENGRLVLALAIAGFAGCLVKWIVLSDTSGFLVVSRALGLEGPQNLTLAQRLGFWRADLLLGFVVIPVFGTWLAKSLFGRYARYAVAGLAVLLLLLYYVTKVSIGNVGTFLSADMVFDALRWGADHPESIGQYVGIGGALALGACLLGVLLLCFSPRLLTSRDLLHHCAPIVPAIGILGFVLGSFGGLSGIPQQRAIALSAIDALWNSGGEEGFAAGMSDVETVKYFHSMTRTPDWKSTEYSGRERGSDVIVFVLETMPNRSVLEAGGLESLPTISRLAQRSFIAERHNSTYPYTSDAVFSIFTGLYPVNIRKQNARTSESIPQALPYRLRERTYWTGRYAYNDSFEADSSSFANMGMDFLFEGDPENPGVPQMLRAPIDEIYARYGAVADAQRASVERKLVIDLNSLRRLLRDIPQFIANDRRYLATYFPILSHGPWENLGGQSTTVLSGRRLLEVQDEWLGLIVEMLERTGRLDRTIIVVTADHGVRTKTEDPEFAAGSISDYSFSVPLLIYAPNTLSAPVRITAPTSHVDITPTVLDLLGIEPMADDAYEGVPIYTKKLDLRRLYFFAGEYLGADAFLEQGFYNMVGRITGQSYRSVTMDFPDHTAVMDARIADRIEEMYRLQSRWARMISRAGEAH